MVTSANGSGRLLDNPALLKARLAAAPRGAGVYVMRDQQTRVIYVGKASSLRNRLRSYFSGIESHPSRTRHLVERIADFEVVACGSEREALILENTLIKRYRPRFNIRLKDDKNYLYLKIPQPGAADAYAPGTAREARRTRREPGRAAEFPRPYYTRRLARDGARYFGPYTNANALRSTVRSLRTVFPFRTCSDEIFRRGRVCLDYHIMRCSGPCERKIDEAAYARLLDEVHLFMDGQTSEVERRLKSDMRSAAEAMDFELAARYRDRLKAIGRLAEQQRVISRQRLDEDVIAVASEAGRATAAVLAVRQGRVTGMETHDLEGAADATTAECLGSFVGQYYGSAPHIPARVLVAEAVPAQKLIAEFLSAQRGSQVEVRVPERGRPRALVRQAAETALAALRQRRIVEDFDEERAEALLGDLAERLALTEVPHRIECYDISNTMGTNSVASMVVFEDGRPRNAHYRHFSIKTVEGADDFRSMQEALRRRFARYLSAQSEGHSAEDIPVDDPDGANGERRTETARQRGGDDSFGVLPDLLIIDGGKGQLGAAHAVLLEAGLEDVEIFGLAKRNEELYRPGESDPIIIPRDSPTLFLVQRIRDEAHRFAITHHRAKRGKAALKSRLDEIHGLGPARKRALLRQFGSVEGVRNASMEEIAAVPGVPRALAALIKETL